IVKMFGEKALDVLKEEPEKLTKISGISPARARQMHESFCEQFGLQEVMLSLLEYGVTAGEALRCYKKWGMGAPEKVKENPYVLCTGDLHIPFERVDAVCTARQIEADDRRRVTAGLLYVLRHNTQNGHTCLPTTQVVPVTAGLLGVPEETVQSAVQRLADGGEIAAESWDGKIYLFLPSLYRAEKEAARIIADKLKTVSPETRSVDRRIREVETLLGIEYEAEQRRAIETALCRRLLILTGGPGTGKTTTLKAILTLLEREGETVLLAAPTGRAAKRMSELTGHEAKTLHRMLEVQWDDSDQPVFARNAKNPLDADTVIVDELSMVDVGLFHSLLCALKPHCRLIMVGDTDQLPAVGAGDVLGDLIRSGRIPTVQLKQVFRQALESRIVANAHRIVAGQMPQLGGKDADFFFLPKSSAAAVAHAVRDLCVRRLPNTYGVSMLDGIQVLCASRKGELGTVEFNRRLQEECNPYAATKAEMKINGLTLRVGDKVMQNKNNYEIGWTRPDDSFGTGVYNGDIGTLTAINKRDETLTVRFDDREAYYTRTDAEDLELAYAVTVHKSQGSEFDMVVMPVFGVPRPLCYRNLLYTAVTRAKRLLVLVGGEQTVAEMVQNDRKTKRYSALDIFLTREADA
ncbi:MAG: ATP-dependent RecD-like DNA helicase, partial [Clostridia bacterium]|nr:ATP-dependent RecD-like DNA helicase [Clostridia bacterium]